jgi:hypothetical protein
VKVELRFDHAVPVATLKARLDKRARHWAEKKPAFGIRDAYRWVSPTRVEASARGARGVMELADDHVKVSFELPFFARPFRERIEAFVRAEAAVVISGEGIED